MPTFVLSTLVGTVPLMNHSLTVLLENGPGSMPLNASTVAWTTPGGCGKVAIGRPFDAAVRNDCQREAADSSETTPPGGVVSLESAASLWQSFLTAASKGLPIATFPQPPGVVQATVDAFSGMLPGPFSSRTVKEWFIKGTVPTQVDNTKVGIAIDAASGKLWQDGCVGPMVVRGFLNLSNVEADYPDWRPLTDGWIARAERGSGVAGGPEKTRTSFFYETGVWNPYGSTWGAPFPPWQTCDLFVPSPSPEPFPSFPSFDPNASPGPSPSDSIPPAQPGNGNGNGNGGGKPTPSP